MISINDHAAKRTVESVKAFLDGVAQRFSEKSFQPHPAFRGGHAQTLAAFAWPRRRRFKNVRDEERLFRTADDVTVLAHCRWQPERNAHPTMVIWHGIEGSSASTYMFTTAQKAFAGGFNVIRMNLRTCGGTEHLTPTIYHGGLTDDLHAVVAELIERDRMQRIHLVGFSLGGNMVLKLAGEYGDDPPPQVIAVAAVSPSIDLEASAGLIKQRSNWLYQWDFVRRLKQRMRLKHELFPEKYDISKLPAVRTLREFDEQFTAPAHGFNGAADYYHRASSLRVIDRIRIPTLIIHAEDDPFIPFSPMRDPALANNPYILLIGTKKGGHVAFISAKPGSSSKRSSPDIQPSALSTQHSALGSDDSALSTQHSALNAQHSVLGPQRSSLSTQRSVLSEDRFWAENRVVEFCKLADETL